MRRQLDYQLSGHVVARGLREVVDHHRQGRTIGDGAIEGQQVARLHLFFVVMRGAQQGYVVSQLRGVFGELQSFGSRLNSGSGYQDFIRRGYVARDFKHLTTLFIREQDCLSRGAQYNNASDWSFGVALNVGFKLFEIHVAVGIKRRGDGREDALKEHGDEPQPSVLSSQFSDYNTK